MSNETQPPAEQRSLVQRGLDAIFGYDFFISYTRRDGGKHYAEALARRLEATGFQIFFDSDDYAMGDDWKIEGKWALKRTSQLVLVASPEALSSPAVVREVEVYSSLPNRRIIPIDFDGTIRNRDESKPIFKHLKPEILFIEENPRCLGGDPSDDVVKKLLDGFNLKRQDKKRSRIFSIVAAVLVVLTIAASVAAVYARDRQKEAESRLKQSESMRLAITAQSYYKTDPTKALRLAEAAYRQTLPENPPAKTMATLMRSFMIPMEEKLSLAEVSFQHPGKVSNAAFSADGKSIITECSDGNKRVWDLKGEQIGTSPGTKVEYPQGSLDLNYKEEDGFGRVGRVSIPSPDGKHVLSATVYPASGANFSQEIELSGSSGTMDMGSRHNESVYAAQFSRDGKFVMIAVGNNVEIWSVVEDWEKGYGDGELVTKFVGHTGDVVSATFSPDGKHILTGSIDGTAKLWNIGDIQLRSFREYAAGDSAGGMYLDKKLSQDREDSIRKNEEGSIMNFEWFRDYARDRGWKELDPTIEIHDIAFSPPPDEKYLLLITAEAYRPADLYLKEGTQLLSQIPLKRKWSDPDNPPQFSRNGEFVLIDGEEVYPTPDGIYCWLQDAAIAPLSENDREKYFSEQDLEFGLDPTPGRICNNG